MVADRSRDGLTSPLKADLICTMPSFLFILWIMMVEFFPIIEIPQPLLTSSVLQHHMRKRHTRRERSFYPMEANADIWTEIDWLMESLAKVLVGDQRQGDGLTWRLGLEGGVEGCRIALCLGTQKYLEDTDF